MNAGQLLTIAEAASYLRGEDTPANQALVRRLIADGKLEARRVGRRWLVPVACMNAYLAPRGLVPAVRPEPPREVKVRRRRPPQAA